MPTPTITSVRLEALFLDSAIQPRQHLNEGKIAEYTDLYSAGVEFPPIAVFEDDGLLYIADGFHRTHAASDAGLEEINAEVHRGTRRDALLYACTANSTHGLPLTADDKRRVVTRLLQDEEWRQWSDNRIAKHCGVAHSFVGRVRGSLDSETSETQTRTYTTRHGTTATMQTGRIGRTSQPPAPAETDAGDAPEAPAEDQAATPEVLVDGSSVLVHASTPLANGSTPRRREADQTPPPDPGSSPPADQHIPYFHLDELVEESIHVLPEIASQLAILASEYTTCTDEGGQPFPSAWTWITAPLPYGRGCDLDGLHASVTLLATQFETLKAAAKPSTGHVTIRQQVLAVLPTIKPPITAPKVVAVTGLPIKVVRRALDGLAKVKATVKVRGKAGQYLLAKKR